MRGDELEGLTRCATAKHRQVIQSDRATAISPLNMAVGTVVLTTLFNPHVHSIPTLRHHAYHAPV